MVHFSSAASNNRLSNYIFSKKRRLDYQSAFFVLLFANCTPFEAG
ncbi:MAG: hypothetical protein U5L45_26660 [Saprospiraceae bacterium]|nr:hypothetical protein [Saprospiraceae bacterium]